MRNARRPYIIGARLSRESSAEALGFVGGNRVGDAGKIAAGDGAKFAADGVGREAGAEQASIERGDLALGEFAANVGEAALQAGADESGFVGFGKNGVKRGIDVTVRHAAGAKIARDAETSLAPGLRVLARVIERVAGVLEITSFAETGDDGCDKFGVFGAALEIFPHFVNRVSAARQGAE